MIGGRREKAGAFVSSALFLHGFVPGVFEWHKRLVDTALTVNSKEAVGEMRRLGRRYGLFVTRC